MQVLFPTATNCPTKILVFILKHDHKYNVLAMLACCFGFHLDTVLDKSGRCSSTRFSVRFDFFACEITTPKIKYSLIFSQWYLSLP